MSDSDCEREFEFDSSDDNENMSGSRMTPYSFSSFSSFSEEEYIEMEVEYPSTQSDRSYSSSNSNISDGVDRNPNDDESFANTDGFDYDENSSVSDERCDDNFTPTLSLTGGEDSEIHSLDTSVEAFHESEPESDDTLSSVNTEPNTDVEDNESIDALEYFNSTASSPMPQALVASSSYGNNFDFSPDTPENQQNFLRCPVCYLDMVNRDPRALLCGHISCKSCILGLIANNLMNCPVCRKEIRKRDVRTIYIN